MDSLAEGLAGSVVLCFSHIEKIPVSWGFERFGDEVGFFLTHLAVPVGRAGLACTAVAVGSRTCWLTVDAAIRLRMSVQNYGGGNSSFPKWCSDIKKSSVYKGSRSYPSKLNVGCWL